jgi:hypothetical protein
MSDHGALRCITVRLPWAAAIMAGVKTVENRTRSTSYRGPVGIHAAAPSGWSVAGAMDPRIRAWWHGSTSRHISSHDMPSMFRRILAVADLVDCHQGVACCRPWGDLDARHLVLANIRPLPEPVVARGSLALPWTAPDDVARAVWEQIGVTA